MAGVGIVLIGRNEGARLVAALEAISRETFPFVYVDSGSTDDSVEAARSRGGVVVELDMRRPFTAARARNEGFEALVAREPGLDFVQFIDGDCVVDPAWIPTASAFLASHPSVAVVCGRRREMHPGRTIYNELCDIEWDGSAGEIEECGGDALVRVAAFKAVRGYDPSLIAGEEPEMCVRLRQGGWTIWRLDAPMTMHDANLTRFRQWWRRTLRNGHAYGEVAWRTRGQQGAIWQKQVASALVWGLGVPAVAIIGSLLVSPLALLLLLVYPAKVVRMVTRGQGRRNSWLYAAFVTLAKVPEALGILRFHVRRLLGRGSALIEYK
jgi:GT2 family glycosyltransferase